MPDCEQLAWSPEFVHLAGESCVTPVLRHWPEDHSGGHHNPRDAAASLRMPALRCSAACSCASSAGCKVVTMPPAPSTRRSEKQNGANPGHAPSVRSSAFMRFAPVVRKRNSGPTLGPVGETLRSRPMEGSETCVLSRNKELAGAWTIAGAFTQMVEWCAWQDLNLHGLLHYHLKVARLPIPPHAQSGAG